MTKFKVGVWLVRIILSVFFMEQLAWAAPGWCESTPIHDSHYKNYVGRATASVLDHAFREAVVQARKEAVEENYGFQFNVRSSGNLKAHSDSGTSSVLTQDYDERSALVRLEGFERVDTFSQESPDQLGISVCVWFRYPVQAIELERKRLASLQNHGLATVSEIVIQGTLADRRRGVIEVSTRPPGARVKIDGVAWGETPLELRGKLTPGKHQLVLDHPNYERVSQWVEVNEGAVSRIDEILKPAVAQMRITTNPPGAMVMIQGKYAGVSPTRLFEVPAGEQVTLVIEHPETKRYERRLELGRHELWEEPIELELKRARLSGSVNPRDSQVTIDHGAAETKHGEYDFSLSAGTHHLHIEHEGFANLDRDITLAGGQALDLGVLQMEVEIPQEAPERSPSSHSPSLSLISHSFPSLSSSKLSYATGSPSLAPSPTEVSWDATRVIGFTPYEWSSSPVRSPSLAMSRLGLAIEYYPVWLIGLRGAYFFGIGSQKFKEGQLTCLSHTLELGVPIHFLWFKLIGEDSLFFEPRVSITSFSYQLTTPSGKVLSTPSTYLGAVGWDAGYRIRSLPQAGQHFNWGMTLRYGADRISKVTGGYHSQLGNKLGLEFDIGF